MFREGDKVKCVESSGYLDFLETGKVYEVTAYDTRDMTLRIKGRNTWLSWSRFEPATPEPTNPSWHDRPTGPGLWLFKLANQWRTIEINADDRPEENRFISGIRYLGPFSIPTDTAQEAGK